MSIRALASNAAWSIVTHLLGRGKLVVASIFLARSLDTPAFAAYSYFQLTVSMLATYAAMGIGITASRFFAECDHVSDDEFPPLGTLWVLSILFGLLFAVGILCLPSAWIDGGLEVPHWLLALGVFSMALGIVPAGGIIGLERFPEGALAAAASAVVMFVGVIAAAKSGSATAAMSVFLLASITQSIGNSVIVVRAVGFRRIANHARLGKLELRKIGGFAGPMIGVSLLASSGSWIIGRMILDSSSGQQGFSLYAIGLQWYSLALFLPGMVSRVVLPRIVKARLNLSPRSRTGSKTLVKQGSLLAIAAALSVCGLGMLFSPLLVTLYGTNLYVDKWLLGAFMLAAIPSAPANTLGNAIVASNGQKEWFVMIFVWFACVLLAAKSLLAFSAWGGAIAHGIASLVLTVLAFRSARKKGLV